MFLSPLQASIFAANRKEEEVDKVIKNNSLRVYHEGKYQTTVADSQGRTLATGKNISKNQVFAFILQNFR